jgi:hypothetical protein
MRILFWKEDKKRPAYSGKRFNLFKVRWDTRLRKTVKTETGERWGFYHPSDGRIIMLRKDPSRYGRVIETPDISVKSVLGTPDLGVVETKSEEEE